MKGGRRPGLYGIMAEFKTPQDLLAAAARARRVASTRAFGSSNSAIRP